MLTEIESHAEHVYFSKQYVFDKHRELYIKKDLYAFYLDFAAGLKQSDALQREVSELRAKLEAAQDTAVPLHRHMARLLRSLLRLLRSFLLIHHDR
jgi:hypothetical protein